MITVIGAGPAGLSTAYYLKKHKLPYQVLEKHTIGYTWENNYDSLRIHTLKEVSALPGLPMPKSYPPFPTAKQHLAYLKDYARHFELQIQEGVEVQKAAPTKDQLWSLETSQGVFQTQQLVVATGIWSTPFRPYFPGELCFKGDIIHAQTYRNPKPFVGQQVLVVGGGNTGTEIAVELAENNIETAIAVRGPIDFVPYPNSVTLVKAAAWFFRHAPRPIGEWVLDWMRRDYSHLGFQPAKGNHTQTYPVVGFELPEAVAAGKVKVYPTLTSFSPDQAHFVDGQAASFDTVILATGYRPTLHFLEDILPDKEKISFKNPRSKQYPHLYLVGFHYPATEGWLQAIGRASQAVVEMISKSSAQTIPS